MRLKAELYIENGVPFLDENGTADNLNGLFDLSFGADYQLAKTMFTVGMNGYSKEVLENKDMRILQL